jgi:lipid II isoglutaminyl synthase (glutamine-hydrolysing)
VEKERESDTGGFNNRLFKIKLLTGMILGKGLILLTRLLGRGGTTLPGRAVLKLDPAIPSALAGKLQDGSILITGTNGKTTTAALISGVMKESGLRCIRNQSGSNMSWGVTSALVEASNLTGKPAGECAIMEVDEGAFPGVVQSIKPKGIVVTNVFRDQLDRYGEVDWIRDAIKRGLEYQPEEGFQVLNGDDPSLTGLVAGKNRWTYGLELELPEDRFQNTGRDIKTCPNCNTRLDYSRIYYAHLGHFHCPSCNFKRETPDVKLTGKKTAAGGGEVLEIELPDEKITMKSSLAGTYNLYNILAAVTCAVAMSIPSDIIIRSIEEAVPSFGRMEQFNWSGKSITMALIKNPVGANEVLRTILDRPDKISLIVAINDKIADGRDVSWLWDVDFEYFVAKKEGISIILVSGLRAWDMAVRFKYAGISPDSIVVEENTEKALNKILKLTSEGENIIILPTYTAMLEIRKHLNRMGLGKPYWES